MVWICSAVRLKNDRHRARGLLHKEDLHCRLNNRGLIPTTITRGSITLVAYAVRPSLHHRKVAFKTIEACSHFQHRRTLVLWTATASWPSGQPVEQKKKGKKKRVASSTSFLAWPFCIFSLAKVDVKAGRNPQHHQPAAAALCPYRCDHKSYE